MTTGTLRFRRALGGAAAFAVALAAGASVTTVVRAATTWTVDTPADGAGACAAGHCPTLRSALAQNVTDGGGDTIVLTHGVTYLVTMGQLTVAANVTIRSDAAGMRATLQRSGATASRVFTVNTGKSAVFTDLVITGGSVSSSGSGVGGGIDNFGTLTLNNVSITGNTVSTTATTGSARGFGGGLTNERGAAATLNGGDVTNNHANSPAASGDTEWGGAGGGIVDDGTMTLNNVTVSGNSVTGPPSRPDSVGPFGGGVGTDDNASLTINGGTITSNTATGAHAFGGGVASCCTGNVITLNGVTIRNNSATGDNAAGAGFGICCNNAQGTINGGTITANAVSAGAAVAGGGVYLCCDTAALVMNAVSVTDNTVNANANSGNGGGVEVNSNSASLTVNGGTITGNSATGPNGGSGGGIDACCDTTSVHILGTTIDNNTAAGYGGGVSLCCGSQTATITGAVIDGNTVTGNLPYGGGVAECCGSASVTISATTISGNSATGAEAFGGGVGGCCGGSSVTLLMSTIDHNTVSGRDAVGGGIAECCGTQSNDRATLHRGVRAAHARAAASGASSVFSAINDTIAFNTASGVGASGGGAAAANNGNGGNNAPGTLNLVNDTVANNTAPAGNQLSAFGLNQTIRLTNVIVNGSGSSCAVASSGVLTSLGHNLDNGTTCGFHATGDISGQDPGLGPLQNNGGSTKTMAIANTSPAANHGDNSKCPTTDQRGVTRVTSQDPVCDIGAFEAPAPATVPVPNTGGADGSPVAPLVGSAAIGVCTAAIALRRRRTPRRGFHRR